MVKGKEDETLIYVANFLVDGDIKWEGVKVGDWWKSMKELIQGWGGWRMQEGAKWHPPTQPPRAVASSQNYQWLHCSGEPASYSANDAGMMPLYTQLGKRHEGLFKQLVDRSHRCWWSEMGEFELLNYIGECDRWVRWVHWLKMGCTLGKLGTARTGDMPFPGGRHGNPLQ